MTDWFWKKLNISSSIIAILALFGLLIFSANIEIKDTDLWLHLAAGKHIVQDLEVPKEDFLSATIAGKKWINHEWLFQSIVYIIYNFAGADGLISMQVVVVGVTFALLLLLGYRRDRSVLPVFLLILVLFVYQLRLTIRPDIFSLLFLTLYIRILGQQLDQKKSLVSLFLIQVFWSNMHGFFILGPMLVVISLAGEWTKRHVPLPFEWNQTARLEDKEYRTLKQALGVVLVACLFNPYTLQGAWYPFSVMFSLSGDSKIFFKNIGELKNPISWSSLGNVNNYPYFKCLIVLSTVSFIWNRRKLDIGLFFFWLVFLLFSLNAVRNVVFFAFAAYFVILANSMEISFVFLKQRKQLALITPTILNILLVLWMFQCVEKSVLRGYFDFDKYERKSEYGGVSQRNFPHKAADFLVENKIQGKFFNDFNSGAYLLGRASPDIKVFIDGRTEVYGADYFQRYKKIWKGDKKLFEEAVKKYDLTGAFLNSVYVPAPKKFIRYLYESKEWILVYFNYDAAIFLKNVLQNQKWIQQYAMDLSQWKTPKVDLLRVGLRNITPYQNISRAYALYNMKFYDKARSEIAEALRVSPGNSRAYELLGKMYIDEENYPKAFEYLRKAKMLNPYDKRLRKNLEKIYHTLQKGSENVR